MVAFDSDKEYNETPYNGEQRMQSVTWILITVIFGGVFIAKRLYFKNEKERIKKGDPQTDFVDVMSDVLLLLLWFRIVFGPPNPAISGMLMTIFMIGLAIGVGFLLRSIWNMIYGKKSPDAAKSTDKKPMFSYNLK
jgi:Flp pilus assembly protein protease CpaA